MVELLAVMFIIVLLVGILIGTAGYVSKRAGVNRTKSEISTIEAALEAYRSSTGTYPTNWTTGSLSFSGAYAELVLGSKRYLNPRTEQIFVVSGRTNILDPFGTPYYYRYPGVTNTMGFDLWSLGPDRSAGGGDNITNWER